MSTPQSSQHSLAVSFSILQKSAMDSDSCNFTVIKRRSLKKKRNLLIFSLVYVNVVIAALYMILT